MAGETYPKVYLYKRLVQAKLFIDQHYASAIDIDNIADEAFFSKFHFIRLFKKVYNKTPHQYLIQVRIDKAMQLLKQEIPVSEVCSAVGFESPSSFSGLFKRIAGLSPSAYVIHHQHLKIQIAKAPLRFIPDCFARQHGWAKKQF